MVMDVLSDRKQNLGMRAAVRTAGELRASCVALMVVARNGTVRRTEFSWGFDQAPLGLLRARFSLLGERPDEGGIELGYSDGRRTVDRTRRSPSSCCASTCTRRSSGSGRGRRGRRRAEGSC